MSRTFFLQEEMIGGSASGENVTGLADAISGLDKELVNEVILQSVSSDNKIDTELLKLKLEVLEAENELIEEEKKQRHAEVAKAEKEKAEKEKAEKEKAEKEKAEKEGKAEEIQDILSAEDSTSTAASTNAETVVSKDEFVTLDTETQPLKEEEGDTKMEKTTDTEEEEKEEEEPSLSSEELDAISQMVSPDPVSAEREKLQSLKAALQEEEEEEEREALEALEAEKEGDDKSGIVGTESKESMPVASSMPSEQITVDNTDKIAEKLILAMDKQFKEEAERGTQIS
jgi:hypothetical protein